VESRLLHHYNKELQYMQEVGGEFAKHFPKIAGRLGMEGLECADPYVERLLEGFAFLTARIQLELEKEFPRFSQHLLEIVYPDYLAPLPSMAVVHMEPDMSDSDLAEGFVVNRGMSLKSGHGPNMQTRCEYRTAHDLTLYPISIIEADYLPTRASLANLGIKPGREVSAGLRLTFETAKGVSVSDLNMDELPLFLAGRGTTPLSVYEQLMGGTCGLSVVSGSRSDRQVTNLSPGQVKPYGFEPDQAMLNYRSRSFEGYRLLREYFAFPERFRFINFTGLKGALRSVEGQKFHIVVHLSNRSNDLENVIDKSNFLPFCTPAINLFPKRADRININDRDNEFHVIADRSRPMDYEIHHVTEVTGYGTSSGDKKNFLPFYGLKDEHMPKEDAAFYSVQRKP
jgi:type VI secretion system protein ImpG